MRCSAVIQTLLSAYGVDAISDMGPPSSKMGNPGWLGKVFVFCLIQAVVARRDGCSGRGVTAWLVMKQQVMSCLA